MLKHDRDEHYGDKPKLVPCSILLTPITARWYAAEVGIPATSLLDFVPKVVDRLPSYIGCVQTRNGQEYVVVNPVNKDENFS